MTIFAEILLRRMNDMGKEEMWNRLLELGVSEETLTIITKINGYSEKTLCDDLYVVSGYRDFEQEGELRC